jgi:hypothetical protein
VGDDAGNDLEGHEAGDQRQGYGQVARVGVGLDAVRVVMAVAVVMVLVVVMMMAVVVVMMRVGHVHLDGSLHDAVCGG